MQVLVEQIMWSSCVLTKLKNEWLTGWRREWLTDRARERSRQKEINNEWLYSAVGACCHFLTQGCETCQHQKSKHVCSASQGFCKGARASLLLLYLDSTFSRPEKCDCSFPFDKSQVCSCGLSHTLFIKVGYHTRPALTSREERHVAYITGGH